MKIEATLPKMRAHESFTMGARVVHVDQGIDRCKVANEGKEQVSLRRGDCDVSATLAISSLVDCDLIMVTNNVLDP